MVRLGTANAAITTPATAAKLSMTAKFFDLLELTKSELCAPLAVLDPEPSPPPPDPPPPLLLPLDPPLLLPPDPPLLLPPDPLDPPPELLLLLLPPELEPPEPPLFDGGGLALGGVDVATRRSRIFGIKIKKRCELI